MPLDEPVRNRITELLGAQQADLHEQLHDTIDKAWMTHSEREGQLNEWRRDQLEKIDEAYQAALRESHDAYEQACKDAHTQARDNGLKPVSDALE